MKQSTIDTLTAQQTSLFDTFNRNTLETWQLHQMGLTLRHAMKSPFYKEHLDGISLSIDSFEQFTQLPLLDKDMLQGRWQDLLSLSQSEISRIFTLESSGSTGEPKRIAFTATELQATKEFFREGMAGLLQGGEKVLVLLPADRPDSVGDLLLHSLDQKSNPSFIHWPIENPQGVVKAVKRYQANCVIGLPHHLLMLAETLRGSHCVRTMLLCSDYAADSLRKRIESCGITTFLHYGSTESGFGGGVECDCHNGVHLREADIFVEILNPADHSKCEGDEVGEIVITTLRRQAMPLIRYRTGDFATLSKRPCSCGGITARLKDIHRKQRYMTEKGKLSMRELDELLFGVTGLWDYRASLYEKSFVIDYFADHELAEEVFPELPAQFPDFLLSRSADFQKKHTGKRMLTDYRNQQY